jgi:hypothetical protein
VVVSVPFDGVLIRVRLVGARGDVVVVNNRSELDITLFIDFGDMSSAVAGVTRSEVDSSAATKQSVMGGSTTNPPLPFSSHSKLDLASSRWLLLWRWLPAAAEADFRRPPADAVLLLLLVLHRGDERLTGDRGGDNGILDESTSSGR